jgi:hypothetical protein
MIGSRQSQYFFDLDGPNEDDNCTDGDGTRLPNDDAALDYANRVIKELKETGDYFAKENPERNRLGAA